MNLPRSALLALTLIWAPALVLAQPITMHCRPYDRIAKDFSLTAQGERFFVIDSTAKTVKENGVALAASWSTKEVHIEGPDQAQRAPGTSGYLLTVIDRGTGEFSEVPVLRAANGTHVKPDTHEIRHGACEIYRPMF